MSERRITVPEVRQAAATGRLLEVFGSGTACIVQPVSRLLRGDGEVMPAAEGAGGETSLAMRLQRALTDIQYGRREHEWSVPVDEL